MASGNTMLSCLGLVWGEAAAKEAVCLRDYLRIAKTGEYQLPAANTVFKAITEMQG